jgi:hypothetical protein
MTSLEQTTNVEKYCTCAQAKPRKVDGKISRQDAKTLR